MPDMSKERELVISDFQKSNKYCKFKDGLTLVGICKNSKCTKYKHNVSCNLKYCKNSDGMFEYAKES
eukprot:UN05390